MGCVASKGGAPVTPALDSSGGVSGNVETSREFHPPVSLWGGPRLGDCEFEDKTESAESGQLSSAGNSTVSFQPRNLGRSTEGEQVAAGWPAWLSANAGEAIQGWVPLKAESFEKLEKVGQGTYSSVFRARENDTGRIVALKKVRFDNFEPESVRFMAREILILRKLDHPNIIKLQGIITSQLSCSIYLVFEYMEHDLAGLSSCSDIKFSEPQIKCYMKQLLSGLEQCHSHGIMHRDIKCANLLVNNEGILKIADFGLANILNPAEKQPLTSRVVTLWYRPPELLLGSTDYDASVDLWSIGCVFAELFVGKPILQARTEDMELHKQELLPKGNIEIKHAILALRYAGHHKTSTKKKALSSNNKKEVEQIHKIFKLCGSPPAEFWKKTMLPHTTVFKSQQPYENCLKTTFDFLPESAFKLLEVLLSIEPEKRGTASTALTSEYFWTKPHACDPSNLPKYHPNKDIDAKFRDETRRSVTGRFFVEEATKKPSKGCKPSQEPSGLQKSCSRNSQGTNKNGLKEIQGAYDGTRLSFDQHPVPSIKSRDECQPVKQIFHGDHLSGPLALPGSTGFAYTRKPKEDHLHIKSHSKSRSRREKSGMLDSSNISQAKSSFKLNGEEHGDVALPPHLNAKGRKASEYSKDAMLKRWIHPELHNSLYSFGPYNPRDAVLSKHGALGFNNEGEKVEFSGPLLLQSKKVDEFLEKHERHVRRAVRKSWFQKGQKQGL